MAELAEVFGVTADGDHRLEQPGCAGPAAAAHGASAACAARAAPGGRGPAAGGAGEGGGPGLRGVPRARVRPAGQVPGHGDRARGRDPGEHRPPLRAGARGSGAGEPLRLVEQPARGAEGRHVRRKQQPPGKWWGAACTARRPAMPLPMPKAAAAGKTRQERNAQARAPAAEPAPEQGAAGRGQVPRDPRRPTPTGRRAAPAGARGIDPMSGPPPAEALLVGPDEAGLRLDAFFVRRGLCPSTAAARRWLAEGRVRIEGRVGPGPQGRAAGGRPAGAGAGAGRPKPTR